MAISFQVCDACGGKGCWICCDDFASRSHKAVAKQEAQLIAQEMLFQKNAGGIVVYRHPQSQDEVVALIQTAIEYGRTYSAPNVSKEQLNAPEPGAHRLDFLEFV